MTDHLPPPVTSKPQMYRRLLAGEFGNRGECWTDPWEFRREMWGYDGATRFAVRTLRPGGPFIQPLHRDEAFRVALTLGADFANISVVQPHQLLTVQGELYAGSPCSLGSPPFLRYTYGKECMRDAWAIHEANASGLAALSVLRHHLDPGSYDRLADLIERHPGHVVEFSHYRRPVGVEPHRLVIWEIRMY